MSGGKGAARVAAALGIVGIVAIAGWGSWQNRQERGGTSAVVAGAPGRGATVDAAPPVPPGCWSQTGVATDPDGGVGPRISMSYCLGAPGESIMTLSQDGRVRCRAEVAAERVGERVRILMGEVPACGFGDPLPRFDALCNVPEDKTMACDIDWGGGLVETFRMRRS